MTGGIFPPAVDSFCSALGVVFRSSGSMLGWPPALHSLFTRVLSLLPGVGLDSVLVSLLFGPLLPGWRIIGDVDARSLADLRGDTRPF